MYFQNGASHALSCRWERDEIFRELGHDDWRDSTVQDIGLVSSRPTPAPFLNGLYDARKQVICARPRPDNTDEQRFSQRR